MKEDQFILENSDCWARLENILLKLKSKGVHKLDKDELEEFLILYNRACGHLSYSRTYFGDSGTTEYLNRLVASAHSYIYTPKSYNMRKLLLFFYRDFPMIFKRNVSYFWVSFSVFMLGFILSFLLTLQNRDNAAVFLPENILDGLDFSNSTSSSWDGSIMSSVIFSNNIAVGINVLALGITLGIGTVWILINNGFILGSIAALAAHSGSSVIFWSMILPHGILELFAVFVCGAAGLMLGYSIINPGNLSRKDSLILRGRDAIKLTCWTIPAFIIAGLIEGFFTPAPVGVGIKYAFSLFILAALLLYLIKKRKGNSPCFHF